MRTLWNHPLRPFTVIVGRLREVINVHTVYATLLSSVHLPTQDFAQSGQEEDLILHRHLKLSDDIFLMM